MIRNSLLGLLNFYHAFLGIYWLLRKQFGDRFWWLALLNTFAFLMVIPLLITLPFALLLRDTRTSAIALILLIGAVVRYVPASPQLPQPTSTRTLRVISYNIWNQNKHVAQDVEWLKAQNPDVIILVEAVNHLTATLSNLMVDYPYFQREDDIMIFSRYPMLEHQMIVLEIKKDRLAGRNALRAVVDVNGQPITVYAFHFSVPRQKKQRFPIRQIFKFMRVIQTYSEVRRNSQIDIALSYIRQEKNPVIIGGDFNMSHTSLIYENFVEAGLVDAYGVEGHRFGMSWPVHMSLPAMLRIDYIWHSADLETISARFSPRLGSDHLAVITDIALPEQTA